MFPGGDQALIKYLSKNFKLPKSARKNKVTGLLVLSFVVSAEGKVGDVKVVRGVTEEVNAEGVRTVKSMPTWQPGRQDGKAVPVQYTLPIRISR